MRSVSISLFLAFALSSCWLPPPRSSSLLPDDDPAPREIHDACTMTATKCSRCHTLDRVLVANVTSPRQWESYVRRMRRYSASNITEADAEVIVRCLVYRSFGPPGETP